MPTALGEAPLSRLPEVLAVALYRFLFAPVLLAVAVLTTSPPPRAQHPPAPRAPAAAAPVARPAELVPAHGPDRTSRASQPRPGSVR